MADPNSEFGLIVMAAIATTTGSLATRFSLEQFLVQIQEIYIIFSL